MSVSMIRYTLVPIHGLRRAQRGRVDVMDLGCLILYINKMDNEDVYGSNLLLTNMSILVFAVFWDFVWKVALFTLRALKTDQCR